MSLICIILLLVGGVLFLYAGAELLVLYASKLALACGMTVLMTGLTVVAFCTSMPEFVSSLIAQTKGEPNMALGNVVGSNIANLGLILACVSICKPLHIDRNVRNFESPLGIVLVGLIWLIMLTGSIGRGFGILFLVLLILYIARHVYMAKKADKGKEEPHEKLSVQKKMLYALLVAIGAGVTICGGYVFVKGAIGLADKFDVSSRLIGLTIVAVGSSLPEFAASFVALARKMPDIAVGNVFGSNIINVLFVLGVISVIYPIHFDPDFLTQDMPFMLAFSVCVWLFSFFNRKLNRISGAVLLLGYVSYLYIIA